LLIDAGADLNYQNADGATALITASVFGSTDIAQMLINAGADLNIQSKDGSTALHTSAFFCREDIVKALLQKGIDTSLRNKYGQTAYETVDQPFENVVKVYDTVGAGMKSLGVQLDYEHIRKTRPKIAQLIEQSASGSEKQ
jgi:hypothetical protein